jgi:hypothetical protein
MNYYHQQSDSQLQKIKSGAVDSKLILFSNIFIPNFVPFYLETNLSKNNEKINIGLTLLHSSLLAIFDDCLLTPSIYISTSYMYVGSEIWLSDYNINLNNFDNIPIEKLQHTCKMLKCIYLGSKDSHQIWQADLNVTVSVQY